MNLTQHLHMIPEKYPDITITVMCERFPLQLIINEKKSATD